MTASIEFKLFAPYNEEATLIGSFSNWEAIQMEKDEKGYFRTEVNLDDGVHEYKFSVQSKSWFFEPNTWVYIIDPYATEINKNKQNAIIRVKEGQKIIDTYTWQNDDQPLPPNEKLVIYEMHVGDFSGGENGQKGRGQIQDIIERLDYLSDLGINALQLMPIMGYPGEYSLGYNTQHFFSVDPNYGKPEDFKRLIDECHGRGIRIILDSIFNHSDSEAPLTQINHDYWYYHDPKHEDFVWGPEFNYEHYDDNFDIFPAREFIGDVVKFWISEYHIDGIRYDAARQIDNFDFMYWIGDVAHQTANMKPFYNVAEYIPENIEITNVDGPMDGAWHESFSQDMKKLVFDGEFNIEQLKNVIDGKRQGYLGAVNMVNYLTSHDQERFMAELGNREIFGEEAFKRVKMGVAILMTAVGIPFILMGEEFGEYKPLSTDGNILDWTILSEDPNQALLDCYKGLIHLRKNCHALYTNNIDFFHEDPDSQVLAYVRWNDEGSRVAVVINSSNNFLSEYQVPNFPQDGTWHEWMWDYDIEVEGGTLITDLGEYEAKVFVWE